jgi:hypothetical protein
MIGMLTMVEALNASSPRVVTLAANTAADVMPNRRDDGRTWVYRYVQNTTGADLYLCVDDTCDIGGLNYHFIIADKQYFSVPSKGRVSAMSVAGGKVATAEFERVRV